MDFTGRYQIPAGPEAVWNAIQDPEILKLCIPGCETVDKIGDTAFEVMASLKIGPVKARFKGKVMLDERDPPRRCVLKGEGQGGIAGFARGQAEVLLTPQPNGTSLAYTASAAVGGKLAQIGQRLMDGAARQIADDFFARFTEAIAAQAPATEAVTEEISAEVAETAAPLPLEEPAKPPARNPSRREGLSANIWVIGLIGVIVILLALFGLVL